MKKHYKVTIIGNDYNYAFDIYGENQNDAFQRILNMYCQSYPTNRDSFFNIFENYIMYDKDEFAFFVQQLTDVNSTLKDGTTKTENNRYIEKLQKCLAQLDKYGIVMMYERHIPVVFKSYSQAFKKIVKEHYSRNTKITVKEIKNT